MSGAPDDGGKPWETQRRGMLLLVSSPSGAGKTSLSRRLVADHGDLILSISATNVDEFYTVRVAGLRELARAGNSMIAVDSNGANFSDPADRTKSRMTGEGGDKTTFRNGNTTLQFGNRQSSEPRGQTDRYFNPDVLMGR